MRLSKRCAPLSHPCLSLSSPLHSDRSPFLRLSFTQYNGVWHCFVGRNFGAYMTHEAGHHVYFYVGQQAVLLFKTG